MHGTLWYLREAVRDLSMIRHDYILKKIAEFVQTLMKISRLAQGKEWREAGALIDQEFDRLIGAGVETVAQLSETELLARVLQSDSTHLARLKSFMLVALLKQAGELAARRGDPEASRRCFLKGLHLLLDTLSRGEVEEWPDFVPKVEAYLTEWPGDEPLPPRTLVLLMRHYEQTGQFAKAEDALFVLLDLDPGNAELLQFGIDFYRRLGNQNDEALAAGGLPRDEVMEGMEKLERRLNTSRKSTGGVGGSDQSDAFGSTDVA